MKKTLIHACRVLLVFSVFFIAGVARADIVQSVASSHSTVTSGEVYQSLGTLLTGIATGLEFSVHTDAAESFNYSSQRLFECNTNAVSTSAGISCTGGGRGAVGTTTTVAFSSSGAGDTVVDLTFSNPVVLDFSKYYFISFGKSGSLGTHNFLNGSTVASDYSNGSLSAFTSGGSVSPLTDAYFKLFGAYPPTIVPLVPQVYSVTTPTEFQITSSVSVPVVFTYLNDGSYTSAGVELTDQSNGNLALQTAIVPISGSGIGTYNNLLTLTANHAYRVRGFISGSGLSTLYSPYVDFSTLSDQFFTATSSLIAISQVNDANASSSLLSASTQFYNLQTFLETKFPFNWVFGIANVWAVLGQATTTSTYTFDMVFSGDLVKTATSSPFAVIPSSWNVIDSGTMNVYYPDNLRVSFRSLLLASIVLAWGFAMFTRLTRIFS